MWLLLWAEQEYDILMTKWKRVTHDSLWRSDPCTVWAAASVCCLWSFHPPSSCAAAAARLNAGADQLHHVPLINTPVPNQTVWSHRSLALERARRSRPGLCWSAAPRSSWRSPSSFWCSGNVRRKETGGVNSKMGMFGMGQSMSVEQ